MVVSSLAGFGFAKYRFPGRDVFFLAIVGILMVPFQSVVVPLYVWMNDLGLLDTYMGIVAPDLVSVFGVFLMRQAIEMIPERLHRRGAHRRRQRAADLLLGDPAVGEAGHRHAC